MLFTARSLFGFLFLLYMERGRAKSQVGKLLGDLLFGFVFYGGEPNLFFFFYEGSFVNCLFF